MLKLFIFHVNDTLSNINIRCLKTSGAMISESNTIYLTRVYFSKPEKLETSINCITVLEIRELFISSIVREELSGL